MNDKTESQDTIGLVVHAYNNYLSAMMGFTELATLECEQKDLIPRLDMVIESGSDAVGFGKELLSSIGRLQVELRPVNLIEIIQEVCQRRKNISWQNESDYIGCKDCLILTDEAWFIYCLELIVDFCHQVGSPKLVVKLTSCTDQLSLTFESESLDLEAVDYQSLFLPFYSTRQMMGTKGVGLATVKGFISQMKGGIDYLAGSGFIINLPSTLSNSNQV